MTPRPTATRADAVAQSRTLEQQLSACETTASEARREPLPRVGLDRAEDDHRAPERSLVAKIVRQRAYPCAADSASRWRSRLCSPGPATQERPVRRISLWAPAR